MKYLGSLLVLLSLIIGIVGHTRADEPLNATWTVCASGCDYSTIASAVADVQVNPGDTLDLTGETFPEYDILLDKDLTLSGDSQQTTIIDAQTLGRVLSITTGTTISLQDLTITGGYIFNSLEVDFGGGIYNNGTLSLQNVTMVDNNIESFACGGAIFNNSQSTLMITDSIISNNVAILNSAAGAICNSGIVSISRTIVTENGARYGGAIANGGTLFITETIFEGNFSSVNILENSNNGIVTIDKTVFMNNEDGNVLSNSGTMTIVNTTFSHNDRGLTNYNGSMEITFSTIAQNNGYGIWYASTPIMVQNSMIADNVMGDCNQSAGSGVDITSLGGNLDSDDSCGLDQSSDLPDTHPGLAILSDYGGNTLTHALLTTSAAIDTAVNCASINEDQRGFPRPVGAACDIGAFEGIIPFSSYVYMPIARK